MKFSLRQIRIFVFVCALMLLAGEVGWLFGTRQAQIKSLNPPRITIERKAPVDKQNIDLSLFWNVWDRLYKSYLDKTVLKPSEMVYGAIRGMVASLGDPYTVFLVPEDNRQSKEDLNGAFEGVGIELGYKDNQLVVIAPLAEMPAEKAGIRAGDYILKIDDEETTDMNLQTAVRLIRGKKGTVVRLTLLREKEKESYEVSIQRDTIVVPSVQVKFVKDVAVLKLSRFGDRTSEEWEKAVSEIAKKESSLVGIILDLRNNPGGYLSGSVFIASEFLPAGIIVQQESTGGLRETFSVNRQGKLTKESLVVLVNEGSASASEIVAGALQFYKRAKVVGEKTFGKGTVQEAQDLPGGSGLHVTISRWLLPSGKSIDKSKVIPDIEVKDDLKTEEDEQFEKALETLSKF